MQTIPPVSPPACLQTTPSRPGPPPPTHPPTSLMCSAKRSRRVSAPSSGGTVVRRLQLALIHTIEVQPPSPGVSSTSWLQWRDRWRSFCSRPISKGSCVGWGGGEWWRRVEGAVRFQGAVTLACTMCWRDCKTHSVVKKLLHVLVSGEWWWSQTAAAPALPPSLPHPHPTPPSPSPLPPPPSHPLQLIGVQVQACEGGQVAHLPRHLLHLVL